MFQITSQKVFRQFLKGLWCGLGRSCGSYWNRVQWIHEQTPAVSLKSSCCILVAPHWKQELYNSQVSNDIFEKILGGEIGTGSFVAGLDLTFSANTLGFRGTFWNLVCVFHSTDQHCRICTKSTIDLVLTNWTQSGDSGRSKTKTVGPAAYFGCKVHKGCSPLSARKFLLFHVLCHHFCVSCSAQAWPSSFTPVWPFQEKLVVLNLFLYSRL